MNKENLLNLIKYGLLSLPGLASDFLAYSIFYYYFNLGIIFSNVLSFMVGVFVNVLIYRKFLFNTNRFSFIKDYFLTFALNGWVYIFGIVVIKYLIATLSFNHYFAKLCVMGVTMVINFTVRKLVFVK